MLSSVSWQQYFTVVLMSTLLYYVGIWIINYKAKLSFFSIITSFKQSRFKGDDQPDEILTTAQHIIDELMPLFKIGLSENELIHTLQQRLKKYQDWEEPGFRETLNRFIVSRSKSICSIHLSERDIQWIWMG